MSIKDNLEKAAAIFGAPNEPKCVFMDKATKDKIVSEKLEKQMHEAIADMFERNAPNSDLTEEKLSIAIEYLESKNIDFTSASYDPSLFVLCVKFSAGIGRALINTVGDSKNDIEEIIDACIKDDKHFDISEHEFSDEDLVANLNGETIGLEVTYQQWGGHINGYSEEEKTVNINKQDAIAMAKALGVTGEDLL